MVALGTEEDVRVLLKQEALSRNTYKLAQLDPECSAFLRQCRPALRVSLAGEGSVET